MYNRGLVKKLGKEAVTGVRNLFETKQKEVDARPTHRRAAILHH